ncbi:MAG: VCBS repeat-containing protein [Candidatus Poseidoniales archaeon]|nr:VCBS repeat-containing protein [Candidatus Poseidoniales archaeon]
MNRRTPHTFFAIFCLCLLLNGCLSSEIPEESPDESKWTATITPIITTSEDNPVVANIRSINNGQVVAFTEPLQGRFSLISDSSCSPLSCIFESYNLSTGTESFSPVRVSYGSVGAGNTGTWIVSDIGILHPSNEKSGRIILFDDATQESTVIIDEIGRTVCAEPGDFDGDGDTDLTLCEFGHDEGTVSWLENDEGNWHQHILDPRPGSIHAIPVDVDSDNDLDIVAVLSQNIEEIMLYRNDGTGNFSPELLYNSNLTYFGMSGLRIADIDNDGDDDIIFTNGDTMDFDTPPEINPNQLHGVAWLENNGEGDFTHHDITRNWGAYDTAISDIDGDGDLDMILICLQMDDQFPTETNRTQIILLEQQDSMWIRHDIATSNPHRMLTIEVVGNIFLVASHDPMNQGGELFTLARLDFTPP